MQNTNSSLDPYNTPLYEAILIEQKKHIFSAHHKDNEKVPYRLQIQLEIFLIPGGVEVLYNPSMFSFLKNFNDVIFKRQINAFFIKSGFFLNSILFRTEVYRCCTKNNSVNNEFIYTPNFDLISEEESLKLNTIIARVAFKSLTNPLGDLT